MNRFQQGSLFRAKRKGCSDVWVFRWYDYSSGKRIYKKEIIGSVAQIQSRREAEKAVTELRNSINVDVGTPHTKTEASCRPVPLHPVVLNALLEWRAQSPYAADLDFLFPSTRFKGAKPLSPDSILEKSIRPALARIGVTGKQIDWHSFRHSLATNLRSLGVDIKVAQELMRHSSSRTTLNVYTRAVDQQKREASLKVMELMLPLEVQKISTLPHPRESRRKNGDAVSLCRERSYWWT